MTAQQTESGGKRLNWKNNIDSESSLTPIDWNALERYAISLKRRKTNYDGEITCKVSTEYNMGGLHVVRRLDFQDGTTWVARLQLQKATPESQERLLNEVHTIQVIRERSSIPVPELFSYEASDDNAVGVAFMIMEFIPADTAMDLFGGWPAHKGKIPAPFRRKFYAGMARIQVELASVRFPKIGSIIKLSSGVYSVGPIPEIGGPFDSAADFFEAWAKCAKFPYNESTIRARTPSNLVDQILISIRDFPSQLAKFAKRHSCQEGPFPIIHTDLYKSNILVDSTYCVQSVIDWENTIVAPWEMVEFIKDLSIVPPIMDGPLYNETESDRELLTERQRYIEIIQEWECAQMRDSKLSTVLNHWGTQNLAHAIWLYLEGRIGFYTDVFNLFH